MRSVDRTKPPAAVVAAAATVTGKRWLTGIINSDDGFPQEGLARWPAGLDPQQPVDTRNPTPQSGR
jgi:hypothetical protein